MKVYYDIINDDELLSDSYKIELLFNGVGGEVKSRMVVKGGEDIDIGRGAEFGGAEADEAVEDKAEKVIDIVDAFRYTETSFSKADYTTYIKNYMKKVKAYLEKEKPDRVADFMSGAKEMVTWVLKKFDDFQFFMGEKCDTEAGLVLAYYKNDEDLAPTFVYFMDGLKARVF